MAFSGYVFRSREEILPFCEQVGGGTIRSISTSRSHNYEKAPLRKHSSGLLKRVPARLRLASRSHQRVASRYRAFVAVGFPERRAGSSSNSSSGTMDLYNSMLLVDRTGELLHVYAKHFLYETDKIWASEGPCFESIVVPELGKVRNS